MKRSITGAGIPGAIGPYSPAIAVGEELYCSGQLGLDPETGVLADGVAAQAEQAVTNLGALLTAAGYGFDDIVKTTIFLVDLADFATVNEIYGRAFSDPFPARSTVQVAALPKGGRVEIEAIAKRGGAAG
ncbi:MAG: Rid family detoxifying hydrolase [Candidatus Limnocylindrus sp.]